MDDQLITRDYLLGLVTDKQFRRKGTTTICTLMIDGFPVEGESHCALKENYNATIGEKVSYENALKQLLMLERYMRHRHNCKVA